MNVYLRLLLLLAFGLLVSTAYASDAETDVSVRVPPGRWLHFGRDRFNSRSNNDQTDIGRSTVGSLSLRWTFNASGDVSATPSVIGNRVYFSDFGGRLWALHADTGAVVWSRNVTDITGVADDYSRAAPVLIGGVDVAIYSSAGLGSCFVFALKRSDGTFLWKTKIETHFAAWITGTPGYYAPLGLVVVGTSSNEAAFAMDPSYPCCSFRGSYVALDATTGAIQWRTYTVPEGYSGGPVWGAGVAYDSRGRIFAATGQGYKANASANACMLAKATAGDHRLSECLPPEVYADSILALNAADGAVLWSFRSAAPDFFTLPCFLVGWDHPNCNNPPGFDADFSMNPMLVPVELPISSYGEDEDDYVDELAETSTHRRNLVVALSKAGVAFAVDSRTGALVWSTVVGPGADSNGFYGGAFDDDGIYLVAPNARKYMWLPQEDGKATGEITGFSLITKLRKSDGRILWQVPDRTANLTLWNKLALPFPDGRYGVIVDMVQGKTVAPLTVANGALFTCTMTPGGKMYALDTADGSVLWSHDGNVGSCNSGPSVAGNLLTWGSGYGRFGLGVPDNVVYAFDV